MRGRPSAAVGIDVAASPIASLGDSGKERPLTSKETFRELSALADSPLYRSLARPVPAKLAVPLGREEETASFLFPPEGPKGTVAQRVTENAICGLISINGKLPEVPKTYRSEHFKEFDVSRDAPCYTLVVSVDYFTESGKRGTWCFDGVNRLAHSVTPAPSSKSLFFLPDESASLPNVLRAARKISERAGEASLVNVILLSHGTPGEIDLAPYKSPLLAVRENLPYELLMEFLGAGRKKGLLVVSGACHSGYDGFLPGKTAFLGASFEEERSFDTYFLDAVSDYLKQNTPVSTPGFGAHSLLTQRAHPEFHGKLIHKVPADYAYKRYFEDGNFSEIEVKAGETQHAFVRVTDEFSSPSPSYDSGSGIPSQLSGRDSSHPKTNFLGRN
jgi:hypothetical protein